MINWILFGIISFVHKLHKVLIYFSYLYDTGVLHSKSFITREHVWGHLSPMWVTNEIWKKWQEFFYSSLIWIVFYFMQKNIIFTWSFYQFFCFLTWLKQNNFGDLKGLFSLETCSKRRSTRIFIFLNDPIIFEVLILRHVLSPSLQITQN